MTVYKVYWTDQHGQNCAQEFTDMRLALDMTAALRLGASRFITMVSENTDMVGNLGVSAVVNGKLPNGEDYTWKKRRL